ncbi:MAG: hypothetical protein KDD62_03320 [Bdellovibrionales bacterium]|nr:hypothetical protein [Bdellovibrionales bacterium]
MNPNVPNDFGPLYAETLMGRLPVEPWNTYSNLIFLLIVVYFARKTHFSFQQFPFLTFCLPILALGFIGGTVFHATRSHSAWLIMDFLPIFVLALMAAVFFWRKILGNLAASIGAAFAPLLLGFWIRSQAPLDISFRISLGYSFLAVAILLPTFLHCYRRNWENLILLLLAVAAFIPAILCRQLDKQVVEILPMGSHFLWHLLGGFATLMLMEYVFRTERQS